MDSLTLNSKIELGTKDGKKASGLLYDIIDNKIYVSVTMGKVQESIFYKGDNIEGIIYDENMIFGFTGTVSDRLQKGNPIYEISDIGRLTRMQRRTSVRADCSIPAKYAYKDYPVGRDYNESEEANFQGITSHMEEGIIVNLSGGGLRLSCAKDLVIGTELIIEFNLNNEIAVKGKIKHKKIKILRKKAAYFYGIDFYNMDGKVKDKIISYVFILMRKGLEK